jgi:uncharacterized membrane protein YhaH (DUF805 family)
MKLAEMNRALLKFLFSPKGRIPRSSFWYYFLGFIGVFYITIYIDALLVVFIMGWEFYEQVPLGPLIVLVTLIGLFSGLVVSIKRCHDRNRSGWYLLFFTVPIIGVLLALDLAFLKGTDGDNKYGPDPLQKINTDEGVKNVLSEVEEASVDESSVTSSTSDALGKFTTQISHLELNKSAEEYYKQGEVLLAKNEFDGAILEFVKVIRISTPDDKAYQTAKKELEVMGFSESDITHISK